MTEHLDNALLSYGKALIETELSELNKLPERLNQQFVSACKLILNTQGKVIVSGIGKSGHIGKKIAASLASTGTPSFFMHPSEALHGDLGMVQTGDTVILISYSGRSKEFNVIIPQLKQKNTPIIAMTGGLDSPLADASDSIIDISIEREACPMGLAPTSSSTNTLVMGDALMIAVMRTRNFNEEDFARSHPAGALGAKLLTRIKDIMRTGEKIPHIHHSVTVFDAMLELSRTGLGLVAVCDDMKHIQGVFTDGDLRRVMLSKGSLESNIESYMSKPGYSLQDDTMAINGLKMLHEHNITAAPVVDNNGDLIGAINLHDLHDAGIY